MENKEKFVSGTPLIYNSLVLPSPKFQGIWSALDAFDQMSKDSGGYAVAAASL